MSNINHDFINMFSENTNVNIDFTDSNIIKLSEISSSCQIDSINDLVNLCVSIAHIMVVIQR